MPPERIIEQVLNSYLYKEDIQELCDEAGLRVSGTKDALIDDLLADDDFDPDDALSYLDKEQLVILCDENELDARGTRAVLIDRVLKAIRGEERSSRKGEVETDESRHSPTASAHPPRPVPIPVQDLPPPPPGWAYTPSSPETGIAQSPNTSVVDSNRRTSGAASPHPSSAPFEFPETESPTLIPEARAPQIPQLQLISEFIESYRPSRRFANEQAYEIELAQALRGKFGDENVKTQVTIYGGRIDIEVLGIGLEIKVPASRSQLQTLLGQISIYRSSYGSNLMVVVFNDLGKHQDVTEFSSLLRAKGVPVFVK